MRLTRWQPINTGLEPLRQLHSEMNRLFQRWGEEGAQFSGAFPPVNVWEDNDAVYVEAELPGLDLKDLEIYVTGGNQLVLKGERRPCAPEKAVWHRQERGTGSFVRSLTLPFEVDSDKVDARFENGVVTVTLPKHQSARPRKITVKGD
jgi:HSP20 family protein